MGSIVSQDSDNKVFDENSELKHKIQQMMDEEKNKNIQIENDIAKLNEQMRSLDLSWKPNGRIEELPAEILFHIFKQLFDLKSVSNCYNTNLRWKKIVEEVFKNSKSKFSFYPYKVINLSKYFKMNFFYLSFQQK